MRRRVKEFYSNEFGNTSTKLSAARPYRLFTCLPASESGVTSVGTVSVPTWRFICWRGLPL